MQCICSLRYTMLVQLGTFRNVFVYIKVHYIMHCDTFESVYEYSMNCI